MAPLGKQTARNRYTLLERELEKGNRSEVNECRAVSSQMYTYVIHSVIDIGEQLGRFNVGFALRDGVPVAAKCFSDL